MDKALQKRYTVFRKKVSPFFKRFFTKPVVDELDKDRKLLLADIEKAISDIRHARSCFEEASSPEMIEACIYEIKSAEARYSFLLRKAKLSSLAEETFAQGKLKI